MVVPSEPRCSRCDGDRWANDRYCGNCGLAFDGDAGGEAPRVISDSLGAEPHNPGRARWLAAAVVAAVLAIGAVMITTNRSDDSTLPATPTPAQAIPTPEAPTPAAEPEPTLEPTPAPTRSTADLSVDRQLFDTHDLGEGQIVAADGQEAKLIDLVNGEVTTWFDTVNFFEIVSVGELGITAATGFHQAEMVGPGALRYFPFDGDSVVVGSLSNYVGGADVVYTRPTSNGSAEPPQLNLYDPATGESTVVQIPTGATWTIRGDSVFVQAGSMIRRMGPDLDDWADVGRGTIEPIPGEVLLVFSCASGTESASDGSSVPCSIDVYRDDGTLSASHGRLSPLIQSGSLFSSGLVRKMSNDGDKFIQLVNGGGGGIWDLDAGLLTALLPGPIADATWLPDDSGLLGVTADDTRLRHITATAGSTTELGVDLGRFNLVAVTGMTGDAA